MHPTYNNIESDDENSQSANGVYIKGSLTDECLSSQSSNLLEWSSYAHTSSDK